MRKHTFAPPRGISTVASLATTEFEKAGSGGSGDSLEFETCGTLLGCCTSNIKKGWESNMVTNLC
jgi:hypothetical protein